MLTLYINIDQLSKLRNWPWYSTHKVQNMVGFHQFSHWWPNRSRPRHRLASSCHVSFVSSTYDSASKSVLSRPWHFWMSCHVFSQSWCLTGREPTRVTCPSQCTDGTTWRQHVMPVMSTWITWLRWHLAGPSTVNLLFFIFPFIATLYLGEMLFRLCKNLFLCKLLSTNFRICGQIMPVVFYFPWSFYTY